MFLHNQLTSTASLHQDSYESRTLPMADSVERACNEWNSELHQNRFPNWIAYYLAWAESDGWFSNHSASYKDPHQVLLGYPHWNIKYHPNSLKSLKENMGNFAKIVDCVLKLSCGRFEKEIVNNKLLKIVAVTENHMWIAAVGVFTIASHEENSVNGNLIVLLADEKKSVIEEVLNEFVKTKSQFLTLEHFQDLLDESNEGYILPKQVIPASIFEKNFREWDNSEKLEGNLKYISVLHKNLSPYLERMRKFVAHKGMDERINYYLVYIKAQIRRDRSLQLSQAQQYALSALNPHNWISRYFQIKFSPAAYKSIRRNKKILEILDEIFEVAAGKLRDYEMINIMDEEIEQSLILIHKNNIVPMTLCINVFQESISLNDTEETILLKYSYCLSVLSIDQCLDSDEINSYFKEGIEKKTIINIPENRIAGSIHELVSLKDGLFSVKDISEKSKTKRKKTIFALYNTKSSIVSLQIKECHTYAEFKEFKISEIKSNHVANRSIVVFRYDYTGQLSEFVTIQLAQEYKNREIFSTKKKELSLKNIKNHHFLFNLSFEPKSSLFSLTSPPGESILSPIQQLYYFCIYMMQTYKRAFNIGIIVEEFEISCRNLSSTDEQEIATCKLLGDFLNSYCMPIDNFIAGNCLVIYSFFQINRMPYFKLEVADKIMNLMSQPENLIGEFKDSKYLDKLLKGLAYQVIKKKQDHIERKQNDNIFQFLEFIQDKRVIQDFLKILLSLAVECNNVIFNAKELGILETDYSRETTKDIETLYNALSVCTYSLFHIIQFLEKLSISSLKIQKQKIILCLKIALNQNENLNFAYITEVAICIHNKQEILLIFCDIGFDKILKNLLEDNLKEEHLKSFQALFFSCYSDLLIKEAFRERYLFKLMESKAVSFSVLFRPQLEKFQDKSNSIINKLIIRCFEKWLLIFSKEMSFSDFINFTVNELESIPRTSIFTEMCRLGMNEIFAKIQNHDFTVILERIDRSEIAEIKKTFKKKAIAIISSSKVPEEMIVNLSNCQSGKLSNWALTKTATLMQSVSQNELVNFVISNPLLSSHIFIIIQHYSILKNTDISKSIYTFILKLWQSMTNRSILIELLQIIQKQNETARKKFIFFIHSTIMHTEIVVLDDISQKINDIVSEYERSKETMQSLSKFYDTFSNTEADISEAAVYFKQFKATFRRIELINYTPPEISRQYVDISKKLNEPITSSIFLAYINERKIATKYKTGSEFVRICEESLIEFERNMKIVETFTAATKIEDLIVVFKEINGEFEKEIDLLQNAFNIPIHSSVKKCVKLLICRESLQTLCRSILDIGSIFSNIDTSIQEVCEGYITYLANYTQATVNKFIEVSTITTAKLTGGLNDDNIMNIKMIYKEFSTSKALLSYLIGKNDVGINNFNEETFDLLKESLDDSDFSEILTQEIIKDIKDIWTILLEIRESCKTFDILNRTIIKNIEKYSNIQRKINASRRYLADIRDFLISLERKEEYKREIVKKIYERSYLKFSRLSTEHFYEVSLKYSANKSSLKESELVDLKDKISLDMVKPSFETENTISSNEANRRFILLIETILRIISKLNSLYDMGFPHLNINQEFTCLQGQFNTLIEYDRKISNLNNSWMHTLKSTYCENFWLTFLSGQEFWVIYKYIETNCCDLTAHTLLKFMGKDLAYNPEWMKRLIPYNEEDDFRVAADRLKLIGDFLLDLPNIPTKIHDFSNILQEKGSKISIEKRSILLFETANIFDGVISIYLNFCGELPRPYQIFFCKYETTWRELSAFLYRWYASQEPKLYTIIECENLTFEIQNKFYELFSELFKSFEKSEIIRPFAIITETSSSFIPSQIRYGLKIKIIKIKENQILPDQQLREIIALIDSSMTVYTSRISGLGKTSTIKKIAKDNKLECLDILIAGDINYSNFGNLLNKQLIKKNIVLHLCIGAIENQKYINEIVGTLSMFKLVFTNQGKYYISEDSLICIEIENNNNVPLKNSLPYLQLLNTIHLHSINLQELEYNAKIIHVGRYLYLYSKDAIHNTDLYFKPDSNPVRPGNEIIKAINDHLQNSFDQIHFNYHQLNIFFNFLFRMLESFEQGSFQTYVYNQLQKDLRGSDLVDISNSFSRIRTQIIENLLDTVKEFTRSYIHNEGQDIKLGMENLKKWEASNHFMMFFSCTGTMFAIYRDIEKVPERY